MWRILRAFAALLIAVLLASCSTAGLESYAENKPVLDPAEFFNGELKAYGVVKKRNGDVIRYFTADILASWRGNTGTLDETFYFDDGEIQKRVWTLKGDGAGSYLASANDVVGEHPMAFSGNALFMNYVLRLAYRDSTIDVKVDDKMFLVDERRIINESVFYKWGFRVASVQLVIEKI